MHRERFSLANPAAKRERPGRICAPAFAADCGRGGAMRTTPDAPSSRVRTCARAAGAALEATHRLFTRLALLGYNRLVKRLQCAGPDAAIERVRREVYASCLVK